MNGLWPAPQYQCAHCGKWRWQTPGAEIIGGIHICDRAISDWISADPDDDRIGRGTLTIAQHGYLAAAERGALLALYLVGDFAQQSG